MLLQSAVGFCVNYYLLEDFLIHPIQLKTAKIDHTKNAVFIQTLQMGMLLYVN